MADQRIRRALLSVSDKTGLVAFATALKAHGIEIVSTGGTAAALKAAGLAVADVSELTGFPEMMDGRVKTLHPRVHGGLAGDPRQRRARRSRQRARHRADRSAGRQSLSVRGDGAKGAGYDACIENIDIGGPAMIRAAAKNHDGVTVVVDPSDYERVLARNRSERRRDDAGAAQRTRRQGVRAHGRLRRGDQQLVRGGARADKRPSGGPSAAGSGKRCATARTRTSGGLLCLDGERTPGVATAVSSRARSSPTTTSTTRTRRFELGCRVRRQDAPPSPSSSMPIRAASPSAQTLKEAYLKALRCDPVSAFGGIVALNGRSTREAAEEIAKIFTEVVIAPDADDEAKAIFAAKKNLRLLPTGGLPDPRAAGLRVKLASRRLARAVARRTQSSRTCELKVVTKRKPTRARDWPICSSPSSVAKHVKSNAIVYAKDGATVGIGAGQMSRVDSARIAALESGRGRKGGEGSPSR